jgi:Pilus formation protein N terminal region
MLLCPAAALAGTADGIVAVNVDQAKLVKLPERVATIVVGNPLIADVTMQPGGIVIVTIYRGVDRESYSCMPICQRRVTLGDGEAYFKSTMDQSGSLSGQASGAAAKP